MRSLFSTKVFLLVETCYLIFLPLLFLFVRPGFFHFRTLAMIFGLVYVGFVIKKLHFSFADLGLIQHKTTGLKETVLPLILTILGILLLHVFLPNLFVIELIKNETNNWFKFLFLPVYVVISVPLQEFIFRGFYLSRLELVSKNKWFLVMYSALIFMLIHLPFGQPFMILGSFFLGLYLANHFIKHRNLYVLIFVHTIIGGVFVFQSIGA